MFKLFMLTVANSNPRVFEQVEEAMYLASSPELITVKIIYLLDEYEVHPNKHYDEKDLPIEVEYLPKNEEFTQKSWRWGLGKHDNQQLILIFNSGSSFIHNWDQSILAEFANIDATFSNRQVVLTYSLVQQEKALTAFPTYSGFDAFGIPTIMDVINVNSTLQSLLSFDFILAFPEFFFGNDIFNDYCWSYKTVYASLLGWINGYDYYRPENSVTYRTSNDYFTHVPLDRQEDDVKFFLEFLGLRVPHNGRLPINIQQKRSLRQYQDLAGIDFIHQRIIMDCRMGVFPVKTILSHLISTDIVAALPSANDAITTWLYNYPNALSNQQLDYLSTITLAASAIPGDIATLWLQENQEFYWLFHHLWETVKSINDITFKFKLKELFSVAELTINRTYGWTVNLARNQNDRKLTAVIFLNDDYEGGEFQILYKDNPVNAIRTVGSLLVFPSYAVHRIEPVTKGKQVLLYFHFTGPVFS